MTPIKHKPEKTKTYHCENIIPEPFNTPQEKLPFLTPPVFEECNMYNKNNYEFLQRYLQHVQLQFH